MAANRIKMIVTDIDGVWTNGTVSYTSEGNEIKHFNVRDGLGVRLAQNAGIQVAVVTGRRSGA